MFLGINKNSFHYKYYQILKWLWTGEKQVNDQTGLCAYVQFLFWFNIFTALISPFLLFGWITLKIGRFIYKILSWTSIGQILIDIFDDIYNLGYKIDQYSEEMKVKPIKSLLVTAFGFLGGILVTVVLIGIILGFGGMLIYYIKNIPTVVAAFCMFLSLIFFHICWGIGWVLCGFGSIISIVVQDIIGWVVLFSHIILISLGTLVGGTILTIIFVKLAMAIDSVKDFIIFKINGFHKARETIIENRQVAQEKRQEYREKKKAGEIELIWIEKVIIFIVNGIKKFFIFLKEKLYNKKVVIKNQRYKVMGFFSLCWQILKSTYHGVCPMVNFIDEKEEEK